MKNIPMIVFIWLVSVLVAYGLMALREPVHAAPATANVCEAVATAGNIVVYYCEPDYGLPFYVNSVGFMAIGD